MLDWVLVGMQGREFMKGPFQANIDKCNRIYSLPYSIQLYLLCPFITWKKTFVTVSVLPYLRRETDID